MKTSFSRCQMLWSAFFENTRGLREIMTTPLSGHPCRLMGVHTLGDLFDLLNDPSILRVDIGPVYRLQRPHKLEKKSGVFYKNKQEGLHYLWREIVFDLDHDPLRTKPFPMTLCKHPSKTLCLRCWRFLYVRLVLLFDNLKICGLLESEHRLFFSGRRGFHLWLFDKDGQFYTKDERANLLHTVENIKPWRERHLSLMKRVWGMLEFDGEIHPSDEELEEFFRYVQNLPS